MEDGVPPPSVGGHRFFGPPRARFALVPGSKEVAHDVAGYRVVQNSVADGGVNHPVTEDLKAR